MLDETRLTIPVNDRVHKGLKQIALDEKRSMTAQAAVILEEFVDKYNFTRKTK